MFSIEKSIDLLIIDEDFIKQRQAEGVKFGRPKKELPNNYIEVINLYNNKEINYKVAAEMLNISISSFYRLIDYKKKL